jgi:hypothetical protein
MQHSLGTFGDARLAAHIGKLSEVDRVKVWAGPREMMKHAVAE